MKKTKSFQKQLNYEEQEEEKSPQKTWRVDMSEAALQDKQCYFPMLQRQLVSSVLSLCQEFCKAL